MYIPMVQNVEVKIQAFCFGKLSQLVNSVLHSYALVGRSRGDLRAKCLPRR